MIAKQDSGGVTVESIKKQQKDWMVTTLKSKLAAKKMSRVDFNEMSFMWRARYIKSGGKIFD